MGLSFDLTVSLGTVIQTAVVLGGGLIALGAMKNGMSTLKIELASSQEQSDKKFDGIQTEIKKIAELLAAQAATTALINGLTQRVDGHERDIRELRHGEGFIRGSVGIDREYPRGGQ